MKSYQVWKSSLRIPKVVSTTAAKLNDAKKYSSSSVDGVPTVKTWSGYDIMLLDGRCLWHNDYHLRPVRWSCLWIVRNDTNSWVQVKGCKIIREQPPGTILSFDLWKEHRLNCLGGKRCPPGVYACMYFDSETYLTPSEWETKIRQVLRDNR